MKAARILLATSVLCPLIAWGQVGSADSPHLPLVYSDSGGIWLRKSMVQSDLQKRRKCAGKVGVVTLRGNADYIFTVDQGLAIKWGWVVARQDGSVVASGSDLGVHHAVDDACVSIVKDWQELRRGRRQPEVGPWKQLEGHRPRSLEHSEQQRVLALPHRAGDLSSVG